jgi:hypothetical protein
MQLEETNQRNKAHFLEIAGSLSIIEFCKNVDKYKCADGQTTEDTKIKEFGMSTIMKILLLVT